MGCVDDEETTKILAEGIKKSLQTTKSRLSDRLMAENEELARDLESVRKRRARIRRLNESINKINTMMGSFDEGYGA